MDKQLADTGVKLAGQRDNKYFHEKLNYSRWLCGIFLHVTKKYF